MGQEVAGSERLDRKGILRNPETKVEYWSIEMY
jgi:hypothetical protein